MGKCGNEVEFATWGKFVAYLNCGFKMLQKNCTKKSVGNVEGIENDLEVINIGLSSDYNLCRKEKVSRDPNLQKLEDLLLREINNYYSLSTMKVVLIDN